jgi:acyl-CoA synthetase (AMP-forming)/AMP-acid ligase II
MVLMLEWDAGEALRLIEREKITYFVGVPTMSLELMQHPDARNTTSSTLDRHRRGRGTAAGRACEKAGGKASPAAQPALGYGLTETNADGTAFLVQLS